jgi:thiamine biosynthesis lipoprotein
LKQLPVQGLDLEMGNPMCLRRWQIASLTLGIALFSAQAVAGDPPGPATTQAEPELVRYQYVEKKMGTVFQLLIWAPSHQNADDAADSAWARIDQLNKTLSDYDPDSELNHLCRMTDSGPMDRATAVSDDLWLILRRSLEAAKVSEGKFDITIGPLSRIQREQRKTHKMPDPQRLRDAREAVGWQYIKMEPEGHRVQLLHAHMQLDVGGIAKGFTADQIIKLWKSRGITRALCGAAGDIAVGDPPPGRDDWRIAIQSLKSPDTNSDYIRIHNYAISTSGDTYRAAIVDGKEFSHIIDPGTGLGLSYRIGVTVVAPDGTTTDWSSTAISIMGPEKGIEMIETIPGAAARVVTIDQKGEEKVYESKRLKEFLVPR